MSLVAYVTRFVYYFSHFFFNDTATTEIYTLSLHDALPISSHEAVIAAVKSARSEGQQVVTFAVLGHKADLGFLALGRRRRSEEHTSELQSRENLVCRLLLEKKKKSSTTKSTPYVVKITSVT